MRSRFLETYIVDLVEATQKQTTRCTLEITSRKTIEVTQVNNNKQQQHPARPRWSAAPVCLVWKGLQNISRKAISPDLDDQVHL